MKGMKVLIDNGHGDDTPGKRSPDGRLKEYAYAREIASRVVIGLVKKGVDASMLVEEENDIPLAERARRANTYNAKGTVLVSIHVNAAGSGSQWMAAKGWSVFVSQNAGKESKRLAGCLCSAAEKEGIHIRRQYPGVPYWVQSLAICRDTHCPAVLTENLFQDNREDVDYLLSEEGKSAITALHVNGILDFLKNA